MIPMVILTILMKLEGYHHSNLVKITAQEVKTIITLYNTLYDTHLFPVSGVTIVAGGAALVAGGALAATSTITPVLSLFFGEI